MWPWLKEPVEHYLYNNPIIDLIMSLQITITLTDSTLLIILQSEVEKFQAWPGIGPLDLSSQLGPYDLSAMLSPYLPLTRGYRA